MIIDSEVEGYMVARNQNFACREINAF